MQVYTHINNLIMDYIAKAAIFGCIIVIIFNAGIKGDWVEIPPLKPSLNVSKEDSTYYTESKTPIDVVFSEEQIEHVESHNTTKSTTKLPKSHSGNPQTDKNRITVKPAKSSVLEVFVSTTHFTPLMSSINESPTNQPTTVPSVNDKILTTMSNEDYEEMYVEDENDEKTEKPVDNVSNFIGLLPFLRTIQDTLMQKAHRSIRSKIQVLRDLKDGLLFDIDQRLKQLWSPTITTEARGYDDSHVDFPSNESALMTIGFLTLAVFLVKLVLQVITAVKAKKTYYNATITTFGRRRRSTTPDIQTTFILSAIEQLSLD